MSENVNVLPDQPVAQITVSQLESLITAIVRRVMREELRHNYYVDEHGVKVLYVAEEATPGYVAELQEDYQAIRRGEGELSSSLDSADQRIIVDDVAQHDDTYDRINKLG